MLESHRVKLLTTAVAGFFTEHSERPWVPSVAAEQGHSKSHLDTLGRWQVAQSDDYVRTSLQFILQIQASIADKIGRQGVRLDEEDVLAEMLVYWTDHNYTPDEAEKTVDFFKDSTELGPR